MKSGNCPQWHRTIPERWITSDQVHVWRIPLDRYEPEIERLLGLLSGDEVVRAGRFRFENDRKHFIAARGALRCILGFYLNQDANKIRFAYSARGKPRLAGSPGSGGLRFNLSHANAFALCAVTLHRKVGIDIERIRHDVAAEQIAEHFFSEREISSLMRLDKNKRKEIFFRYWTRKEAYLKATGDGISSPMNRFDVSVVNEHVLTPIVIPEGENENTSWYIEDLSVAEGYAAAIVVEGADCKLTCFHYPG